MNVMGRRLKLPGDFSADAAGNFGGLGEDLGGSEFRVLIMQQIPAGDGRFQMFVDAPAQPGV
jgi:hypothetical protein